MLELCVKICFECLYKGLFSNRDGSGSRKFEGCGQRRQGLTARESSSGSTGCPIQCGHMVWHTPCIDKDKDHSESRQRRLPSICIPCSRESNMKYNIKKGGRAQCSTPQLPKCHGACGPYPPGPTGPQVTVSSGSSWAGRGSITQILLGEPSLSDLEHGDHTGCKPQ